MTFDARRYDREVIGPLRGTRGRLPQGDLRVRYAIEAGFTAEELAQHLRDLRGYWQRLAAGPDFDSRAEIGRLLLVADQELVRSAGSSMFDPAWWHGQTSTGVDAVTGADVAAPESAGQVAAPSNMEPMVPLSDWRLEAQAFVRQQLWQTHQLDPAPQRFGAQAETSPDELETVDTERAQGITVELLTMGEDDCLVGITWPRPDVGDVQVRLAETFPEWESGTVLDAAKAGDFGERLIGEEDEDNGNVVLQARVPKGYHVYVPFLLRGDTAVVGGSVGYGAADGVRQLRVARSGDTAVLSWSWPAEARSVRIEIVSSRGTRQASIDWADYERGNGAVLNIGPEQTTLRVMSVSVVDGRSIVSAPSRVTLEAARRNVSYTLARSALPRLDRSRQLVIGLNSAEECPAFDLVLVAKRGDVMPLSSEQGEIVQRWTGIELSAGLERQLIAYLPAAVDRDRPYWMRCFGSPGGDVVLLDPPITSMRVR